MRGANEMAMQRAFQFFLKHAGYATPPGRAVCALELARAEKWASEAGVEFLIEFDQDADASFVDTWPEEAREAWHARDHECVVVSAVLPCPEHGTDCKHTKFLASLGGIFDADSAYLRVVRAELASEARSAKHGA